MDPVRLIIHDQGDAVTEHADYQPDNAWRPVPAVLIPAHSVEVGQVIAWDYRAWEVTHVGEPGDDDRIRCTLRLLHGPRHPWANTAGDMGMHIRPWRRLSVYHPDGRVWLCSCCGDPAPCRAATAERISREAAKEFEKRLARMGPGICYACGEVITQRQGSVKFPGEHADMPGTPGPRFHIRRACLAERRAYAIRAGTDLVGEPGHPDACSRCGKPGGWMRVMDGEWRHSDGCTEETP